METVPKGRKRCIRCGGKGRVPIGWGRPWSICPECEGDGTVAILFYDPIVDDPNDIDEGEEGDHE